MPWYDQVFLECIFSIEDRYISDRDLERLRNSFLRDHKTVEQIVFRLLERHDFEATPRLNVNFLFEMIENLTDDDYDQCIRTVFQKRYGYNQPAQVTLLSSDIRSAMNPKKNQWDLRYEKLIEFLIFLFPIRDGRRLPAFNVFHDFANDNPERGISLLEARISTGLSEVRTRIWEMLAELAYGGITMPQSLIEQAHIRLSELASSMTRERREIDRFIRFFAGGSGSEANGET